MRKIFPWGPLEYVACMENIAPVFSKKCWMHSGECEVEHQGIKHNVLAFQMGGGRFGSHQGDGVPSFEIKHRMSGFSSCSATKNIS